MSLFYFWHSLAIIFLMIGSFFGGKVIGEKNKKFLEKRVG
jgi:hypothetical protein